MSKSHKRRRKSEEEGEREEEEKGMVPSAMRPFVLAFLSSFKEHL